MSAIIKSVSLRFPVGEIVLFRSIFAMATLVVWLARRGEFPHALRTRRKLGHIGRSLAGSGGMFANFIALSLLPLADATAFTFATPLLVVPMAAMTLGETVRPYRWAAVGIGFVGVLVMLSDDLGQGVGATAGYSLGATVALRRRVLLGGGDDPDPAADALRGDRSDRLLFLDGDGGDQRRAADPRRCLAERRARRELLRRPDVRRAERAANSACWRRSACSAAPGRS